MLIRALKCIQISDNKIGVCLCNKLCQCVLVRVFLRIRNAYFCLFAPLTDANTPSEYSVCEEVGVHNRKIVDYVP